MTNFVCTMVAGWAFFAGAQAQQQRDQQPAPPPVPQQEPAPVERRQPARPPLAAEAQPAPYRITVNAREVVLDVVVTDRHGHSVTGLKPGDFTLLEDGVPMTLRSVSEHRAMTPEQVARLSPPGQRPVNLFTSNLPQGNTNAVTVILIDALDSPIRAQMYLREQVIAFMKTLPPGHMFAIFQLDTSMHLVQGFTSDPAVLLKAVQSKRNMPSLFTVTGEGHADARKQILDEGLHAMGRYLAGFDGRKNIIWFTGSIPHTVLGLKGNPFPDAIDYDVRAGRAANAISLSRVAIYPIDVRGVELFSSHFSNGQKMDEVAAKTGGQAYHNTNDLKHALSEITETSSNYYTIAYAPTNPVWRAHHRNLELRVTGMDATLLYRHGYYGHSERPAQRKADVRAAKLGPYVPPAAASADTQEGPAMLQVGFADAMELGSVPAAEVRFDVSIAPAQTVLKLKKDDPLPPATFLREDFQTRPFRTYRLLYSVDPGTVNLALTSDGVRHGQIEYVVAVYNPEGEIINSLLTSTEVDLDEDTYAKALRGEKHVGVTQDIAVPAKGNYFLRIGVHDLVGDLVGATEVPVDTIQLGVAGPGQSLLP